MRTATTLSGTTDIPAGSSNAVALAFLTHTLALAGSQKMSVLPSTVVAMTEVKSVRVMPTDPAAEVRGVAAVAGNGAYVPFWDLEYAVIDVETTGWTPEDSGITEIGAVRVRRGEIVAEFTSLVNPGTPVPEPIAELTGISDQMLAPAPPVAAVLPGLLAFAEGCVLTAHNAPFDVGFLRAACAASDLSWPGYPVIDTVRLARQLMVTPDEVPDCKLQTLAEFFGTPVQPSHRALADARATAWVLRQLLRRLDNRGITTLAALTPWLEALEATQAAEAEARAAEAEAAQAGDAEDGPVRASPAGAEVAAGAAAKPTAGVPSRPEADAGR
jgi:DNA polymerase III epsilon subunit family exonuclease